MALIEIKRDPSQRDVRQFSYYWLPAICFVLSGLAVYRFESWRTAGALAAVGGLSIVLGAIRPTWMRAVFLGWMWAAFPIGWLVSHALIAAIYFLLITPMALVMRATGRDPLSRRFDRDAKSYWVPRPKESDPGRYFRQF
jgi:multisubunit Na+/H+ antiporter MnhG subunit